MIKDYKEKLRFMIENWNTMSQNQIAEKLNVSKQVICVWAIRCRKAGINLKKNKSGIRAVEELAEEFKNKI